MLLVQMLLLMTVSALSNNNVVFNFFLAVLSVE